MGASGELLSEEEYREQIAFVSQAADEVRLEGTAPNLAAALDGLREAVEARRSPARRRGLAARRCSAPPRAVRGSSTVVQEHDQLRAQLGAARNSPADREQSFRPRARGFRGTERRRASRAGSALRPL